MDAASALCNLQLAKNPGRIESDEDRNDLGSSIVELKKLDLSFFPSYRKSGTFTSIISSTEPKNISDKQFSERRNMMMHHRASHERLRNSMFSRIQDVINEVGTISEKRTFETAKSLVEATLTEYERMKVSAVSNFSICPKIMYLI